MNALFPILAAILQAGSFTLDKVVLSLRQVSYRAYVAASFPLFFAVNAAIFLVFRPSFPSEAFVGRLGWLLALSVVFTILTNFIFYRALDDDGLGELQTIGLIEKVPIIIFASILFADERKFSLIVLALVAALAVVWSHWERHHFQVAKNTLPFVVWILIAAPVGAAISKELVRVWNPISLELVRSAATAAIFWWIFSAARQQLSHKALWFLIATNVLSAVAWILFLFSYQRSGIVYTVLLFSLQPLLVYAAALLVLKERFQPKKFVAFLVVLGSIAAAQFMR